MCVYTVTEVERYVASNYMWALIQVYNNFKQSVLTHT